MLESHSLRWKYVFVRRLAIYVRDSIDSRGTRWAVFEPNVGIAPARPAEFAVFRIRQIASLGERLRGAMRPPGMGKCAATMVGRGVPKAPSN